MAEIDSYVTGVGAYPTAPDTSVQAFLEQYQGGEYNNPYRKRLLQSDAPAWGWETGDWHSMKAAYEQWKNNLTNRFNADLKQWETAYNSPLNQSELLESAGYNRNWLQGASGSQVPFSDSWLPMDSEKATFSPSDSVVRGFQALQGAIDTVMGYRKTEADINLKNAQADQIEALTPYKAFSSYLGSAEKGWKMYPDYFNGTHSAFPLDKGMTVSTQPIPDDSIITKMTALDLNLRELDVEGKSLTNAQRQWVVNTAQPMQKKMYELQQQYLSGQISLQAIEKEIQEATKEARIEYGGKGIAQQYYLKYLDAFLETIGMGCRVYSTIRTGQDMDFNEAMKWMKATGEITAPLPGAD